VINFHKDINEGFDKTLPLLLDINNNNLTINRVVSLLRDLNKKFKPNKIRITASMILAWIIYRVSKEKDDNILPQYTNFPRTNRKKKIYKGIIVFLLILYKIIYIYHIMNYNINIYHIMNYI